MVNAKAEAFNADSTVAIDYVLGSMALCLED
jgi:hypothetical protein